MQTKRLARLKTLAVQVHGCVRCGLHAQRSQAVFARGTGSSGLFFVGEGPGVEEDVQGFPFVGPAGQMLDWTIEALGLSRDEVYVCNVVKCRPPNNRKPTENEVKACAPYLSEQIELIEPTVIVALGYTATQALCPGAPRMTIVDLRGKWMLHKGSIATMPTFHPAYVLCNPEAALDFWEDLEAVLRQLGRPPPASVTLPRLLDRIRRL